MDNKTITEFGFCIICRIMEISEGVILLFFSPVVFADLTDRHWVFDRAYFLHWFTLQFQKLRTEAETLFYCKMEKWRHKSAPKKKII